jgi:5-oxoprolinase (ATP-hydrolysing) subunit A
VVAVDGTALLMPVESVCVHGDTPGAAELARAVRTALTAAGVDVRPFAT